MPGSCGIHPACPLQQHQWHALKMPCLLSCLTFTTPAQDASQVSELLTRCHSQALLGDCSQDLATSKSGFTGSVIFSAGLQV